MLGRFVKRPYDNQIHKGTVITQDENNTKTKRLESESLQGAHLHNLFNAVLKVMPVPSFLQSIHCNTPDGRHGAGREPSLRRRKLRRLL